MGIGPRMGGEVDLDGVGLTDLAPQAMSQAAQCSGEVVSSPAGSRTITLDPRTDLLGGTAVGFGAGVSANVMWSW